MPGTLSISPRRLLGSASALAMFCAACDGGGPASEGPGADAHAAQGGAAGGSKDAASGGRPDSEGAGGEAPGSGASGTPITDPIVTESVCSPTQSENARGSGAFGCWTVDRFGQPAYDYNRPLGEGAAFTRRDGPDGADDHWHQIGNQRVTATVHADGRVRLFDGTHSSKWVSPYSEYSVGVQMEGEPAPLPPPDEPRRRLLFGQGYAQFVDQVGPIVSERSVFAPYGDLPALIVEYRFQNTGDTAASAFVTETWDATIEDLLVGLTYGSAPDLSDGARDRYMGRFEQTARYDSDLIAALVDTDPRPLGEAPPEPDVTLPAVGDPNPGTLAVAALSFTPSAFALQKAECVVPPEGACEPKRLETRGASTTRFGPPPNGLVPGDARLVGPVPARPGQLVASMSFGTRVPPHSEAVTAIAIVYDDDERIAARLAEIRAEPLSVATTVTEWKARGPSLALPDDADAESKAMARELSWHVPYLLGAATYDAFYGVHVIDQGSAYGYLQGLRGAARDSLINAVAVLPFDRTLAREQIEYVLGTTYPESRRISYGTSGHGQLQDALVHNKPSDLDLWLMWAIVEYTQATRDFDFLEKSVNLHPPSAGVADTVHQRLESSLDWLEHDIGYGAQGLLKVGSGDWSDGISFLSPDRGVFAAEGESVFNSAFAAYVFPRVAALLESRDAALSARYAAAATAIRAAVSTQYQGRWFVRAWDGQGGPIAADDGTDSARLSLEHHTWLLIGDVPTPDQRESVIAQIGERLSVPSPIGTWLMYPPIDNMFLHPGWDVNGGVWSAMNGLLVWGLSRSDPEAAWRELLANSMTRHAETYPDLWYGIWSGPDAYNAAYADRPGETFYHLATPMTDYPVQNSNRHAAPLIDAVKLAGFESEPDGLVIDPRMPAALARFALYTPLYGVDYRDPLAVSGHVKFVTAGTVRVRVPFASATASVSVNGAAVVPMAGAADGWVTFAVPAGEAQFIVRAASP